MKKILFLGCLVVILRLPAVAQDIVRLRDGSEVHGRVLEHIIGDHVRLRGTDGNVVEYPSSVVSKVTIDRRDHPFAMKGAGFYLHAAANLVIGNSFASSLGTSVTVTGGWQWNTRWMTGIGIGKEWIRFQHLLPIMADVRLNLLPTRKGSPFLQANAGYAIPLGDTYGDGYAQDWWTKPFGKTYGGVCAGLQIGFRSFWGRHLGYTFTAGLRYQHLRATYPDVFFEGQQIKYASNERMNWWLGQVGVGLLLR